MDGKYFPSIPLRNSTDECIRGHAIVSFPCLEVDLNMKIMHHAFEMLLIFSGCRLVAKNGWTQETEKLHMVIDLIP